MLICLIVCVSEMAILTDGRVRVIRCSWPRQRVGNPRFSQRFANG